MKSRKKWIGLLVIYGLTTLGAMKAPKLFPLIAMVAAGAIVMLKLLGDTQVARQSF